MMHEPWMRRSRRQALQRLAALGAAVAAGAGCGGGVSQQAPPIAGLEPPPPPPPPAPPPPPPPAASSLSRLKDALAAGGLPAPRSTPLTVRQGTSNDATPLWGAEAELIPAARGFGVNPNPVTLRDAAQVWAWRRDAWTVLPASWNPDRSGEGSWYSAVQLVHPAATTSGGAACGLHFVFDGSAFEVLFAGNDVQAVLLVDGELAAPQLIRTQLNQGTPGSALGNFDTFVRFELGTRAERRIALHARSTLGPKAIAVRQGDRLSPWDRSAEPSMVVQADSYGQAWSGAYGTGGIFVEAALRLGIPHVDVDAIGGTGYAPNNTNADTRNPGNAFVARLPGLLRGEAPDLFIAAGGINDNNSFAAPPLYDSADAARAAFDGAVARYYADLRAALPQAVIVGLGPWLPDATFRPEVARSKADTVLAALQRTAGPWIFVDNLAGGWRTSNGATASGTPWQTGSGHEGAPRGDGNGDLYVGPDGTHPNVAGVSYLAQQLADALKAALQAL